MGLKYRLEPLALPDDAQVRDLRTKVGTQENHPQRWQLDLLERRLKGEDGKSICFWHTSTGWRRNSDYRGGPIKYHDVAMSRQGGWGMSDKQLTLIDPALTPPSGYDFEKLGHSSLDDLDLLLSGGLAHLRDAGAKIAAIELAGSDWTASIDRANGRCRCQGIWDSQAGRGFIKTMTLAHANHLVIERTWSKWEYDSTLGRWVALNMTEVDNGHPLRRLVWDGTDDKHVGRSAELLRTPRDDEEDAVRGRVTYRSVIDHAGQSYSQVQPDGTVTTVPMASLPIPQSSRLLRYAGWLAAGLLLIGLFVLRARRSRANA
ncbi:MAG: hypothetical protein WD749_13390 [Phycisphaerales bacterium]